MSYRHQFSLKGLMIAIALVAFVLSGLFAKFVSLGSAPLASNKVCIEIDLVDSGAAADEKNGQTMRQKVNFP